MSRHLRWLHAPETERERIHEALTHPDAAECIAASPRRTLLRLHGQANTGRLLKLYHLRGGPHPWRESLKLALRVAAPQREWRALCALAGTQVPVPAVHGLARVAGGDALVVQSFVAGPTLHALLQTDPAGHSEELTGLADAVRTLHSAGWAHGDLHPGNVIVGVEGPVLIDWQRARPCRPGSRRQILDLAQLDHALSTLAVPAETKALVVERALATADANTSTRRALQSAAGRIGRRHAARRARERAGRGDQPSKGNARHSPSPTRS